MIVSIHQPNYLPYLGFFDKMRKADVFVIYDDAQFKKDEFQHRNRIRIHDGWKYLTVPVEKKRIPINQIRIKNEVIKKGVKWNDDHFRNIKENYEKAPYYSTFEKELKKIYSKRYEYLVELNLGIIYFLKNAFDIETELVLSSKLGFKSKGTERLVEMVEALGGDTYISGVFGREYLELRLFNERGINVVFQDFKHPVYPQQYKGFVPNMAAIDALFNVGKFPE